MYMGQGVGFSKLWAQVGSQRTVAGGSAPPPNSRSSTWGPRKMPPIKDWDGLGPLSQASYLGFPHLYLKHKDSKLTQPLPGLKHRRMDQEGGWGEAPSTEASAGEQVSKAIA